MRICHAALQTCFVVVKCLMFFFDHRGDVAHLRPLSVQQQWTASFSISHFWQSLMPMASDGRWHVSRVLGQMCWSTIESIIIHNLPIPQHWSYEWVKSNEEESIQPADTGSTFSLLFISIHALNHILGYRLLSLGDTWLIAVSCCSLPPAMCWLIHRQRIWFSAWRSSCRNFHLRVLSDGPCWQNRVRKGTDFFFFFRLVSRTRLWRDRRWSDRNR